MATALKITYPPSFTTEQYDQIVGRLEEPAEGALFHWVEETPNGLVMHDVWESREDFDAFITNIVGPIAEDLGVEGGEPTVEETAVYHFLAGVGDLP